MQTQTHKPSRPQMILAELESGRELSGLDIWYKYGVYRASVVISRLRAKGHNIQCRMVEYNGVRYGEYKLIK
jgi:hypothetical protein